jgi:two-component system, chemotaxis family, chemotaxis protein CheY
MQQMITIDHANRPVFELPAVLDLAAGKSFLDALREKLTNGGPLRMNASAVETLTFPCIQIILAALRSYDHVSIESPSIAFVSAFEDLAIDWTPYKNEAPDRCDGATQIQSEQKVAPQSEVPTADSSPKVEGDMPTRILTIDDSKTMRDMLMLTLVDAGFDVLQAVDGQDGLEVLDKERVDLIITDINMPRMDGYEVIRQLRCNPNHKSTPILVLTTESESTKKNLAREIGATGWMVKPFDPDRLVATIRKVVP